MSTMQKPVVNKKLAGRIQVEVGNLLTQKYPKETVNQQNTLASPRDDKKKQESSYRPIKSSFQRAELVR